MVRLDARADLRLVSITELCEVTIAQRRREMDIVLIVVAAAATLILFSSNILAIRASTRGSSLWHRVAWWIGVVGLVSFLVLLVACVDLFSQIWVARPGYSGWQVGAALSLAITTSIAALILWLKVRADRKA